MSKNGTASVPAGDGSKRTLCIHKEAYEPCKDGRGSILISHCISEDSGGRTDRG